LQKNIDSVKQIINTNLKDQTTTKEVIYLIDGVFIENLFVKNLLIPYLFWCIITAIFITFGAPFWNDIASSLLRIQKRTSPTDHSSPKEANNG
jgi:hypothetical protein